MHKWTMRWRFVSRFLLVYYTTDFVFIPNPVKDATFQLQIVSYLNLNLLSSTFNVFWADTTMK